MGQLIELLMNVVLTFFLGMTPERPLWLRRLVQALWILLALIMVIAWGYGVVLLLRAI
jgi:hypothetical protein